MSGGPEDGGWTVGTLRTHLLALLNAADLRYEQRYEAQQGALTSALLAAKEAAQKTELADEKRFVLLNELRDGVATSEQLEALEKVVDDLADRINRSEGKGAGLNAGWGYLVAVVTVVGAIIAIILALKP